MALRSVSLTGLVSGVVLASMLGGCTLMDPTGVAPRWEDGTYRGGFYDRDQIQVVVQFALEDNQVTEASFRQLAYGPINYRLAEDRPFVGVANQYRELLAHLVGQDINTALADLYSPGEVVIEHAEVDGFSGATIRSSKIISAIRDGLNRGVYSR